MIKKELKERGSVAIYVIAMIFGFFVIVGGAFFVTISTRKLQLRSLNKVKEVYESRILKKDEIIEERKNLDISGYAGIDDIKSNLIVFLDGYNNNGGGHSNKTKAWKNLANNVNKVTVLSEGWRDNSLAFNGRSIQIDNIPSLSKYTMEIVFSVTSLNETIIIKDGKDINNDIIIGIDKNKKIYAKLNNNIITLKNVNALETGKKYTLTVTSTGMIYLNGVNLNQGNQPMQAYISQGSLLIGGSTFSGNVFGIRLYKRELSKPTNAPENTENSEINKNLKEDEKRFDIV